MNSLGSAADTIRDQVRPPLLVALVIVLLLGVWVGLGTPWWPTRYPRCPEPIGDFNGVCMMDGDLDGDPLFRYEAGRLCGDGTLLPNGEEFWTGRTCL